LVVVGAVGSKLFFIFWSVGFFSDGKNKNVLAVRWVKNFRGVAFLIFFCVAAFQSDVCRCPYNSKIKLVQSCQFD